MSQPADLGIPRLPPRAADSHKGDYGRVLIVGGARGFTGAAILAATAALRAGAGLVTIGAPAAVATAVHAAQPCAMALPLPDSDGRFLATAADAIVEHLADCHAFAIGPGLGATEETAVMLDRLLPRVTIPAVIDADALNVLARRPPLIDLLRGDAVLTPHPGEMRRLLEGAAPGSTGSEREATARRFADRTGATVVLKGHRTVVARGERLFVNSTGNPGMATGGSGDVLTGIITALLAQQLDPFDAAVLGVHVHGLAGDLAAARHGEVSMIASDIIACLGDAFRQLDDGNAS